MNNSQTTIFFIKCTQIASACLMLLTVSCGNLNDQYVGKRKCNQKDVGKRKYNQKKNDLCTGYEWVKGPMNCDSPAIDQTALGNIFGNVLEDLRDPNKINCTDDNGRTLLHYVTGLPFSGIVQLLLEIGANIYAKDNQGITPYDIGIKNADEHIKNIFLEQDEHNIQSFHKAINDENLDEVTKLLSAGYDVNALCDIPSLDTNANPIGISPLIRTIINNDLDIFKELLNVKDIDIHACDRKGNTALYYAARYERLHMQQLLSEHNANIYANTDGDIQRIDLIKDPNIKEMSLKTDGPKPQSLHEAAKCNNFDEIKERLLQIGTNISRVNN